MATDQPSKLRVMVDANILVAGSLSPRFPYEVLQHAVKGDYKLVLSPQIIHEAREAITKVLPQRGARLESVLKTSEYEEISTPSDEEIAANAKLICDPKDVHVALSAIAANVDFLVTLDKDFTEKTPENEELQRRIRILLPGTFLREYMDWTSEGLEAIRHRKWVELENLDE